MATTDDIETTFRLNYRQMLIFANSMLHDADAARDIVHDVFESVLNSDVKSVTAAYLLRGVRFACLKHMRNLSARDRINKLYAADCREIETEDWPDAEDLALINEIVDTRLPQTTKRIVKLKFGAMMTYREIANELNVSEVTVYKHLRHALNVLRQYFNANE